MVFFFLEKKVYFIHNVFSLYIDQIHNVFNEPKKYILAYKCDRIA